VVGALERARELTAADEQVVVTGTLYLVGVARAALRNAAGSSLTGR
jgi:folylpolyglutamate synthase/dihydropteroate synthase